MPLVAVPQDCSNSNSDVQIAVIVSDGPAQISDSLNFIADTSGDEDQMKATLRANIAAEWNNRNSTSYTAADVLMF